jgi:hypothetical protein
VETPFSPFDPLGQLVRCRICRVRYICTPENDYYAKAGTDVTNADDGVCFSCIVIDAGLVTAGQVSVVMAPASITCPVCTMTSYHPMDILTGYCSGCHQFTTRLE